VKHFKTVKSTLTGVNNTGEEFLTGANNTASSCFAGEAPK
jgi:hypothetical protein